MQLFLIFYKSSLNMIKLCLTLKMCRNWNRNFVLAQGVKKTKPVEAFNRMISVRHPFKHGEDRNVLVFCKDENQIKDALDAGAALAGGSDIVKLIMVMYLIILKNSYRYKNYKTRVSPSTLCLTQDGELSVHNYDVVIAHPTMMPEVLTLRGLLKRKHPSIKGGKYFFLI